MSDFDVNAYCAARLFYGYTHGSITGDSPELDIFNAVQYADEADLAINYTNEDMEYDYEIRCR